MAQNLKEISTEKLFNELDTTIARLQAERDKSRELLARLINKIEGDRQWPRMIFFGGRHAQTHRTQDKENIPESFEKIT
jgi:hypothetical protein